VTIASEALNKYWIDKKIINPYSGQLFTEDEYYGRKVEIERPDNVIEVDFGRKSV